MKNVFILFVLTLLFACNNNTQDGITRDIPRYIGGSYDIFYLLAKDKQKQLGLDSLENGFHDLQIRIWYDHSLVKERKLIIISNKDSIWTATIYEMQVEWDGVSETVVSKKVRDASPKAGWPTFSRRILELQILTLPTQDDVEGYSAGDDGTTYNVEVATKNSYRFYSYWEPHGYKDRFPEARNMSAILELLDKELSN